VSRPNPPALTIRHNGSQQSFAPGHEVVVGRDLHADLRIPDPRISRAHLILRFDQGRWRAIDNSLNGTYLNGYRMPVIDIHDGQSINMGNPQGPRLTFQFGPHQGPPRRPQTRPMHDSGPPTLAWSAIPEPTPPTAPTPGPSRGQTSGHTGGRTGGRTRSLVQGRAAAAPRPPMPRRPVAPRGAPAGSPGPRDRSPQRVPPAPTAADQLTVINIDSTPPPEPAPPAEFEVVDARPGDVSNLATKMVKFLSRRPSEIAAPARAARAARAAGTVTIGRANDNDIVIPDVLASRQHASLMLTPVGTEIRDSSINGTFINGTRIGSAILTDGDVVTIGNADLVFSNGTLVPRGDLATRTGGLQVREVEFAVDNGKKLLNDISLVARPGTLTAIIGGSGAGKTTLARLIAGYIRPSSGSVTFEGHDIHAEYASLRSRIGMVPQDDVVHHQLTVRKALGYAAELRLPPDTSKADRARRVAQVLEELGLTKHADTRVDKLSGGQRKRASVALELLTGPSLLILDEPTSGLDPALDHQVMMMLRELADAGRVVIVVTHMLSYLDVCDQLLLVAPGGKTAYCGPPDEIGEAMGTTNWAKIFTNVGADPDEANRRFLARGQNQRKPPARAGRVDVEPAELGKPVHTSLRHQISTVARRQVRLVVADRAYFVFLALLPFVMGALSLTVPGRNGFHMPVPHSGTGDESVQILNLLLPAAAFMGTALTIRDLVGERAIFQREQAVGLSATAYLLAKIGVYCGFAIVQSAIVTAIVVLGKSAPSRGALLIGHGTVGATTELFLTVAGTCVASAILGLVFSALVRSHEQIMPLFVVSVMAQLVLCGGMVPVTGRLGLDQLSFAMPARWGYAAAASTVDLRTLMPGPGLPKDRFWQHSSHVWLFDMGMLAGLSLFYTCFVRWRIRLRR
jgi:ABC-type multidrug transport system ATPase subunit/predicted component of type VI protein secretion system